MRNDRPARGWLRLKNPLATRRPPEPGSLPEAVLSVPPLPTLLVNDDWRDSIRGSATLAIATTDGLSRVIIELDQQITTADDPDYAVFLAHPNRLFIRPADGRVPALGDWLPLAPDDEVDHLQQRTGRTVQQAQPFTWQNGAGPWG